jgi:hypothetical protein
MVLCKASCGVMGMLVSVFKFKKMAMVLRP